MEMCQADNGVITITRADWIEEFSLELLRNEAKGPFVYLDREFITVIAANGVWVYRLLGWGDYRYPANSVKAVQHSHVPYTVPFQVLS